jgi:hypothetical protein
MIPQAQADEKYANERQTACDDRPPRSDLEKCKGRRKGKPVSVIIPIKDYEQLLERVEDAADVVWLKRPRRKPLHYRPLEEYLSERNRK